MPTYEYQCKSCEHRFEIWQKMTDNALTVCPECNGAIRRILFPAGIVFKGSGFYKTDPGNGPFFGNNNQARNPDNKKNAPKTRSGTKTRWGKTGNEKALSTKQ